MHLSSKRVLPSSPPTAAWLVVCPLLERKSRPDQRRGPQAPARVLGSRFRSISFSSTCAAAAAHTGAEFDAGVFRASSHFTSAKELPCLRHTSALRRGRDAFTKLPCPSPCSRSSRNLRDTFLPSPYSTPGLCSSRLL